jgi:cation-transporting P-type ATPase C
VISTVSDAAGRVRFATPGLALADIGIAMGVSGTDVAVETADVALAGDDLRRLVNLRDLGRRVIGLIRAW